MLRAYHRALLPLALVAACGVGEPPPVAAERRAPGPDCEALIAAARSARLCDAELERLANLVEAKPDENRCRREVRHILRTEPVPGRIHSIHERRDEGPAPPLGEDERAELAALELPGFVVIRPDLPPGPGLPSTSIELDEHVLAAGRTGAFEAAVSPGLHTIRLRHAGEELLACVRVDGCAQVELTAHGSQLARHERVSPGACGQPGLDVATVSAE